MEQTTTTVTVEVAGETRTVEAYCYGPIDDTHAVHVPGVVATIGQGSARYPDTLTLHRVAEGGKVHFGNKVATDPDGRVFQYHYGTCVRNRQARIVGWADVAGVTNHQDQTRSATS